MDMSKKRKPQVAKRRATVGSFAVKDRGTTVAISPKSLASLERFGARYSAALSRLAKR
jgi:hypothetical protein